MKLPLTDPRLFGNEAGEEEDPAELQSYFVNQPVFQTFTDANRRLAFVRASRGMGKSALLTKFSRDLHLDRPSALVIRVRASDFEIVAPLVDASPSALINQWQQRICGIVTAAIGTQIGFAASEQSTSLVEAAEIAGFKSKNLLGCLIDRFAKRLQYEKPSPVNQAQLLQRVQGASSANEVWLFVDDLDATFTNTPAACAQLSSFFSACRILAADFSGISIRGTIRADVWNILKRHDAALDKTEQYVIDIEWTREESKRILAKKIYSFATIHGGRKDLVKKGFDAVIDESIGLVFRRLFDWGGQSVQPDVPINILSHKRPRWAAQLCKLAAVQCVRQHEDLIGEHHVNAVMPTFGKLRLDDLYAEHLHQCPKLRQIVEAFAGGPARFSTPQLLEYVRVEVIKKVGIPEIDGIREANGAIAVARFLFRIDFIIYRDTTGSVPYYISFQERPDLLVSDHPVKDTGNWDISASFRNVLRIRGKY